jgi:hypothetical protein
LFPFLPGGGDNPERIFLENSGASLPGLVLASIGHETRFSS